MLHNTLLKGLCNIVSSKPACALWRLSRLVREEQSWQQAFETQPSSDLLTAIRNEAAGSPFGSNSISISSTGDFAVPAN